MKPLIIQNKKMTARELLRTIKMNGFMDEDGVIDQVTVKDCVIDECKSELFPPISFVSGDKRTFFGFTIAVGVQKSLFFGHQLIGSFIIGNIFKD